MKKRAEVDRKEAPVSELKELEDKDIKDIVDTQLKLGYSAITDGEYRRHSKSSRADFS